MYLVSLLVPEFPFAFFSDPADQRFTRTTPRNYHRAARKLLKENIEILRKSLSHTSNSGNEFTSIYVLPTIIQRFAAIFCQPIIDY